MIIIGNHCNYDVVYGSISELVFGVSSMPLIIFVVAAAVCVVGIVIVGAYGRNHLIHKNCFIKLK